MMMMMQPSLHLTTLLLLFTKLPSTISSPTNDIEAARYSTLPPTVFAPTGRLFGVERVAREAIILSAEEESCCTVFAVRCGARECDTQQDCGKGERGELTVMVGIGPISPSLHRDVEFYRLQQSEEEVTEDRILQQLKGTDEELKEDEQQLTTMAINATKSFYKPLQIPQSQQSSSSLPISILSPTLITGTGGTSIDSSILLRRSIEVALSLYKLDNGGIDFFASHSLEGGTTTSINMDSISSRGGGGGAASVQIEALVRRIADMAQSSTQNLGSKYGRMLSSSLLAMGVQQPQSQLQNDDGEERNGDKLCIWRVDPTGQFWKCDASAVGRGTVEIEAELLSRVRRWKTKKKKNEAILPLKNGGKTDDNSELDQDESRITNNDVRSYLSSLTEDEAIKVASDCLVNGIMNCKGSPNEKRGGGKSGSSSSLREWMEYDLRRRMQCVILRSSCEISSSSEQSLLKKSYEVVRRL